VRALFEPCGKVDRVNLVTDRDTGRARGFAFVEMTDSVEAHRAISALNRADLEGRRSTGTRPVRRLKVGAVDSRAAPKATGVSGGSPGGRVCPHGWQCWPFQNRLVQLEHLESIENRIAQARQVMCRRRALRRLGPMARPRSNQLPTCNC
jgi:hypothetical protein